MTSKLHTTFEWCNDISTMRHFYSTLLGMTETAFRNDETASYVVYQAGETQIVITTFPEPQPIQNDWTWIWGHQAGVLHKPAWVIEVGWDEFDEILARLQTADVPIHPEAQSGHDLRQVVVQDPMGKTISVDSYRP